MEGDEEEEEEEEEGDDDLMVESTRVNIQVVELEKLNLRRKAEVMQVAWNKLLQRSEEESMSTGGCGGDAAAGGVAGEAMQSLEEGAEDSEDDDEPLRAPLLKMKEQITNRAPRKSTSS